MTPAPEDLWLLEAPLGEAEAAALPTLAVVRAPHNGGGTHHKCRGGRLSCGRKTACGPACHQEPSLGEAEAVEAAVQWHQPPSEKAARPYSDSFTRI